MKKYFLLTPLFAFFLGMGVVFAVSRFSDVPVGHWAENAINWNDQAGIMSGGGDLFRPNDNISRAEVAVITQRLHDLISSERATAIASLEANMDMNDDSAANEDSESTMEDEDSMSDDGTQEMDDNGTSTDAADVQLAVEARNFAFLVNGESNPELRVKQGDTVRIELTSTDGTHNWIVDELAVTSDTIDTAQTTVIEFTADKAGTFMYYCGIGNHRAQGMEGTIIVE